jgi:2-polyprenyl-3-methyl-5-hydroxy-6-metoxy-1,4-benzoquinol methylase
MQIASKHSGHDDWDQHWDRFAAAASANPAQRMRHRIITRLIRQTGGKNLRICDIGSGQGDLVAGLVPQIAQAEFVGIELSASGVEISRKKSPTARFHVCDLFQQKPEDFGLRDWATHAVCSEVLEHVDDPVAFLKAAAGFIAPGGQMIVTVPGGPMSAFDRHIGHRQHFTRDSIKATLHAAGFKAERVYLSGFPFFNLYRLVVIARGKRLVADVDSESSAGSSGLARAAMALFDWLFRLNVRNCRFGWQVVAVARKSALN